MFPHLEGSSSFRKAAFEYPTFSASASQQRRRTQHAPTPKSKVGRINSSGWSSLVNSALLSPSRPSLVEFETTQKEGDGDKEETRRRQQQESPNDAQDSPVSVSADDDDGDYRDEYARECKTIDEAMAGLCHLAMDETALTDTQNWWPDTQRNSQSAGKDGDEWFWMDHYKNLLDPREYVYQREKSKALLEELQRPPSPLARFAAEAVAKEEEEAEFGDFQCATHVEVQTFEAADFDEEDDDSDDEFGDFQTANTPGAETASWRGAEYEEIDPDDLLPPLSSPETSNSAEHEQFDKEQKQEPLSVTENDSDDQQQLNGEYPTKISSGNDNSDDQQLQLQLNGEYPTKLSSENDNSDQQQQSTNSDNREDDSEFEQHPTDFEGHGQIAPVKNDELNGHDQESEESVVKPVNSGSDEKQVAPVENHELNGQQESEERVVKPAENSGSDEKHGYEEQVAPAENHELNGQQESEERVVKPVENSGSDEKHGDDDEVRLDRDAPSTSLRSYKEEKKSMDIGDAPLPATKAAVCVERIRTTHFEEPVDGDEQQDQQRQTSTTNYMQQIHCDIVASDDWFNTPAAASPITPIAATYDRRLAAQQRLLLSALDEEATMRLYGDLTLMEPQDLSLPETRFTRRCRMPPPSEVELFVSSADEDVENDEDLASFLEKEAEDEETAIIGLLQAVPWDNIPLLDETGELFDDASLQVDEYMVRQLSQVDASYRQVCQQLYNKLACSHVENLDDAGQGLHDLDHHLYLADMHQSRCKESIERAMGRTRKGGGRSQVDIGVGVAGAEALLHWFDQQDVYRELGGVLDECYQLVREEATLQQQLERIGRGGGGSTTGAVVTTKEYESILRTSGELQQRMKESKTLIQFDSLRPLQHRLETVAGAFRERLQEALQLEVRQAVAYMRSSSKASPPSKATSEHLQSLFDAMEDVYGHDQLDDDSGDDIPLGQRWASCIVQGLLMESSKCLARALIDPKPNLDSDFDQELMTLALQLQQNTTFDLAKLKTITHNLITIRFDFEAPIRDYLPWVYHRLCALLTDVLYCHLWLIEWHENSKEKAQDWEGRDSTVLSDVRRRLFTAKLDVWLRCEEVLAWCLDEYLSFSKRRLNGNDASFDEDWSEDLEGLHDLYKLSAQFCSLAPHFLDQQQFDELRSRPISTAANVYDNRDNGPRTDLLDRMAQVFRKHLRSVHVAAMTNMGKMLSAESWQLVPLTVEENDERDENTTALLFIQRHLARILRETTSRSDPGELVDRTWQNRFEDDMESWSLYDDYSMTGNPFLTKQESEQIPLSKSELLFFGLEYREGYERFLALLESVLDGSAISLGLRIGTEASVGQLSRWITKLVLIGNGLPLIAVDTLKVVHQLCDLYVVTAFRLCCGNGSSERLVLGLDSVPDYRVPVSTRPESTGRSRSTGSTTGLMGFARRKNSTAQPKPPPIVSTNLEAEICAPVLSEHSSLAPLRQFLGRGQASLEGIVKLDRIELWLPDPSLLDDDVDEDERMCAIARLLDKRQGAAWSCLHVTALVDAASGLMTKDNQLVECALQLFSSFESYFEDVNNTMETYLSCLFQAVPLLVQAAGKIGAARAMETKQLVSHVQSMDVWSQTGINEHANDYVDEMMVEKLDLLWKFLSTAGKLPRTILDSTWTHLITISYEAMLEAFARIPHSSTEGRSLMSMDVAAFATAFSPRSMKERRIDGSTDEDHFVPSTPVNMTVQLEERQRLDTYIKIYYLPGEDVMSWLKENYATYQFNHCCSLVSVVSPSANASFENGWGVMSSSLSTPSKNIDFVRKLFRDDDNKSTS